jgi:hypothetical protein
LKHLKLVPKKILNQYFLIMPLVMYYYCSISAKNGQIDHLTPD